MEVNQIKQAINRNISWVVPISITLITAIGYLVAYVFEIGYCDAYGIPSYLIVIDLPKLMNGVVRVVIVLGLTMCVWYFYIFRLVVQISSNKRFILGVASGMCFSALSYVFMYWDMWKMWIVIVGATFGLFLIVVVWIYKNEIVELLRRLIAPCIEKTMFHYEINIRPSKQDQNKNKEVSENMSEDITGGRLIWLFILCIGVLIGVAFSIGQADAIRQDKFLTISEPKAIVYRIYGDAIICQQIKQTDSENSTSKWQLINDIFVINRSHFDQHLTLEKIGRFFDYK